jgi:hypothetical protein
MLRCCSNLSADHFAMIDSVLDAPWSVAELDFMCPETSGDRPANFDFTLTFLRALLQVAARGPQAHQALIAARHLLKPTSTYRAPWLMQQVAEHMGINWQNSVGEVFEIYDSCGIGSSAM